MVPWDRGRKYMAVKMVAKKGLTRAESTMLGIVAASGADGIHVADLYRRARKAGVGVSHTTGHYRHATPSEAASSLRLRGLIRRIDERVYLTSYVATNVFASAPSLRQVLLEA